MTQVVIDIGCADWGTERSIGPLVERFAPEWLFGFDPAPAMAEREGYELDGTRVVVERKAAGTFDGTVVMYGDGTRGSTALSRHHLEPARTVECFDLARFVLDRGARAVVKLDCEGMEYQLLRHLIATDAIALVDRVLIEWHEPDRGNERPVFERVLGQLGVPLEEWA